jgi:hypothetical protein
VEIFNAAIAALTGAEKEKAVPGHVISSIVRGRRY